MIVEDPLLIFDLGNVILRHDETVLFARISAACDDPEKARPMLKDVFAVGGADLRRTEDFFDGIRERIGFSQDFAEFEKLWCCHFSRDPRMEDLVRSLAAKYRLVVLSNTNDAHWRFLNREYDIMRVPHALYTSFELGMEKPGHEIYRHVLKAETREPGDAIFIDDKIANVEAARAVGINGIHFTAPEALRAELSRLGVE